MERLLIQPRANWELKCEEIGFHFYYMDGLYWNESVCYRFTEQEIEELEAATLTLHQMCLEAVDYVISQDRFFQLHIPVEFANICRKAWERDDPTLYGRFDLAYDGKTPPKLLEYNADTPTALLEASVVQWTWLEEVFKNADQFNLIHENLLAQLQLLYNTKSHRLHFTCAQSSPEDRGTVNYLRDLAIQVGFNTQFIDIEDIGWSESEQVFCDLENDIISTLFKLYPWEWLIQEPFGQYLIKERMQMIEPAWKMILSNKAILPILWELFPNHPNLLPAYFEQSRLSYPFVSKPIFGREGENISIYDLGSIKKTSGMYEGEPLIYQAYCPLPNFDGYYPVVGAWIIGDEAAGIGIREDITPITQNSSCFVPHFF